MKKILTKINLLLIFILTAVLFAGCKKDENEGYANPQVTKVNVTEGAGGAVVIIEGKDLASIKNITFEIDNVPVNFNPALNNSNAVIFRVPETAKPGVQNILLTNAADIQIKVPFKVLALAAVTSIWPYDFEEGTTVTLTGSNLATTTRVLLTASSSEATIVSAEDDRLVIIMPASIAEKTKLAITNEAGSRTSDFELYNVNKAVKLYTEEWPSEYFESWSWGGTYSASNEQKVTGNVSIKAVYDADGAFRLHSKFGVDPVSIDDNKILSFNIKGGAASTSLLIRVNENAAYDKTITVPANKWINFRIPVEGWIAGLSISDIWFQNQGAATTLYFDNILLVK